MQKNAHPGALTRSSACLAVSCLALGILFLDQVSKYLFFDRFLGHLDGPFWFFSGWVQQTIHRNYGLTFDIPLPLILTLIASLGCIGWLVSRLIFSSQSRWRQPTALFFMSLVLGGAIGNLADRLVLGFVRDWLLIGFMSAINLADICIAVGLIGLLGYLREIAPRNVKATE